MSESRWYTHGPSGIEYYASGGLTIDRVIFRRWNDVARVDERVSVHWTEATKWADADPCGGLGLCGVMLSDGREAFATGRYFNANHPANKGQHGLCAVHVGAYESEWMRFPLRKEKVA
jgi:hypothetical protein